MCRPCARVCLTCFCCVVLSFSVSCLDANNYQAILRTAESFGVQHVWVVETGLKRKHQEKVDQQAGEEPTDEGDAASAASSSPAAPAVGRHDATGTLSMGAGRWLSLRHFSSTSDCIAALREDGREIWVTSLAAGCVKLDRNVGPLPKKLAIVLGREIDGVSAEMIAASQRAVFLPMIGFSESFNVSVAGALVLQRLFDLAPEAEGEMSDDERMTIRRQWYRNLSISTPGAEADYMDHWLPRWPSTVATMQSLVASEGEGFVIRPIEDLRIAKIQPKVRRRMEREGQRSVIVHAPSRVK